MWVERLFGEKLRGEKRVCVCVRARVQECKSARTCERLAKGGGGEVGTHVVGHLEGEVGLHWLVVNVMFERLLTGGKRGGDVLAGAVVGGGGELGLELCLHRPANVRDSIECVRPKKGAIALVLGHGIKRCELTACPRG